jgi:hypothetical protein
MESKQLRSRGFTLIASLMLLLLLSGIAIGLLMMVNTEGRAGTNDLENNLAYRAAEGAMEKMTSDLSNTFQNIQAPTPANITALGLLKPTNDPAITYPDYSVSPRLDAGGNLVSSYGQIKTGSNAGLYAQILPIDLKATAQRPLGDQVSMMRTVEVALIPVFQFGVFSDSDLSFFASPDLTFKGRVHTNGDLYIGVANTSTLTFTDKITVWGNVIRKRMPNGLDATNNANNDNGTVILSTGSGSRAIAMNEGSVIDGPTSAENKPTWQNVSTGPSPSGYNYNIVNGAWGGKIPAGATGTGAKQLTLPFVGGGAQPYEIIRRPPRAGDPTSAADSSRLGTQAQIRILLSDNKADLVLADGDPDTTQDVSLGCVGAGRPGDPNGLTVNGVAGYYWAWANSNTVFGAVKDPNGVNSSYDANFIAPGPAAWDNTIDPAGACSGAVTATSWPLIGGFLRVEVNETDGKWHVVTNEWLGLGFARGLAVPTVAGAAAPIGAAGTNTLTDHRKAILYFQVLADRDGDGRVGNGTAACNNVAPCNVAAAGPAIYEYGNPKGSPYNWFPINLYDAREGENWDAVANNSSCTVNGIMNAVELDVGNLRNWLLNSATGKLVDNVSQNGYILYFSDRRGMRPDPNAVPPRLMGEYGFEDTVNLANNGVPDNAAEAIPPGKTYSPEDVNQNKRLDIYGAVGVGDGFGLAADTDGAAPGNRNPFKTRIANCFTTGRKNRVTGARHVLKLVDGGMGNLPTRPVAPLGGFTVASENPVYIQGDYNSNSADPTWNTPTATEPTHAAAAIIADAVTLLSNNWQDAGTTGGIPGSMHDTANANNKNAVTTYYRTAIAAGKNVNFPNPAGNPTWVFGTDGGLHNFLRFLEDWSGQTLYYKGSLVSLYYSTYATGTFKCCTTVYHPPVRNYVFDPLFQQPQNLPPGTPMFRDVDNLSFRQDFTPH